MSEKTWKLAERRIAAMLGGRRVPVSGRRRGESRGYPDIAVPELSVEVKSRKALPAWIGEAVAQARAAATDEQTPLAVLHEVGKPYREGLVVMTLGDFIVYTAASGASAAPDPSGPGPGPR